MEATAQDRAGLNETRLSLCRLPDGLTDWFIKINKRASTLHHANQN